MANVPGVIEFLDNTGSVMVKRMPDNGPAEIKWGTQLTVRESQEAVFFRDGKALDVFKAGRHVLQTQNIPVVGKWVTSFGYGPNSPFRAEVYFIGKQLFPNLKWGTREPILFRDSELKMIRLRSFGIFSVQVADSLLFVNKIAGTQGLYTNYDIEDYLRGIIVSRLTNILGDTLKTVFDMPSSFDQLSLTARTKLQAEFEGLGLYLHDFFIKSISVPEEVQKIIDQRSGMSAIGNMDEFMKYQIAVSMENASKNPGTKGDLLGGGLGAGMGMGMGFMVPQLIQQSMSSTTKSTEDTETPLEKLKKLKELLNMEVITQEEFDEKKKKLMDLI